MRSLIARFKSSKTHTGEDNPHLCSKCIAIFDAWWDRDDWYKSRPRHSHHHIVGLQTSARNGCPICAMFLRGLPHGAIEQLLHGQPSHKSLVMLTVSLHSIKPLYSVKLDFRRNNSEREAPLETEVDAFTSVNHDTATGTIQEVADAESNWELIKKWLNICQETHIECTQNNSLDRQLPTRLIEVGDTNMDLRLCRTEFLPRDTRYLTLSHCWGGKVFTTLTRSNMKEFLSHIPTESLSKTFREAITTTRKLGFKYLWIDSLCIIQGDEADWQHEASKMESVYSNSTLNIAASAAPNGNFGCFTARLPGKIYGCKVTIQGTRGSFPANIMVWDITIKDMTLALLDNVLDSRAWAFQESFLAPRTLYFTADQLLWECISMSACETFPGSFNTGAVNIPAIKTRIWDLEKTDPDQKWAMIISDYSGKSVTFPKDQLIAVSGIARLFATKFRTTYLAGMWKENLVPQLAWFALEPSGADTRDSMPSWTWASVNTRVSTSRFIVFQEYFPLVAVLEATTVVVDDDFGDVKEGTIRMRCRLPFIAGIVEEHNTRWFSIRLGLYSPAFKLCLYPDRTRYSIGQELYLLPLLRGITPDLDLQLGTRYKLICGVVVEPAQPGSYRRTGYFVILGDTEIEWVLKAQKVASYEDPGFIGEASGSDEEGQKMCIITLK